MNSLIYYIATAAIIFTISVIIFILTGLIKNRHNN